MRNPYPNGQSIPPQNNGHPGYGQRPPRDPEYEAYLRRRREMERRQAEARRQEMRDRERREKQRRKAERERRIKRGLRILLGRLLVFGIILVILCGLTGLAFLLYFNHTPDAPDTTGRMTYCYGGSETRKTPMEEAITDGVVYICFNDLAAYLGMMESGTAEAMKFILPVTDEIPANSGGTGKEESITFYSDTLTVNINGQTAHLDIPNILRGTEVWVSSTFLTDYINNLSYQYDSRKSTVLVSRQTDPSAPSGKNDPIVYLPVSFKLKSSASLPPVSESEIPGVS